VKKAKHVGIKSAGINFSRPKLKMFNFGPDKYWGLVMIALRNNDRIVPKFKTLQLEIANQILTDVPEVASNW